jgi:hypothetical protein
VKLALATSRIFLAILFLGLFSMAVRNVTDPDVWWHLKTGQFIAAHKAVPHTDPFSYTRSGAPWVAHEWLTDLLVYQLHRAFGWSGLIVIFAAVISAAFFLLYLRCGPAPYVAGIATLVAACATVPLWGIRPQILSLLLTSLWLLILERSEKSPSLLWWTLPLTLLWVNLHAGFALGLAILFLFLVGQCVERLLTPLQQDNNSHLRFSALIFLLDLLIVPLNPNGARLFSYPLETLRSAAMQKYILEWASPNFHHAEYWPFLLIVLVSFAILIWSRSPVRPRDLLLLLVSLYAALCSIRMIPFFVLIAIPIISKRLGTWPSPSSLSHPRPPSTRSALNAAIVIAMLAFAAAHLFQVVERQTQAEKDHFPSGAVAFLQTHPPSGPIFNNYDWGGYLIWKIYPSTRVFIDGRADLYGQPLLDQFADTYSFKGTWQQNLRDWNITTVLVPPDSALATGLRHSPEWHISYEDQNSLVLTAGPAPVPGPMPSQSTPPGS